MLLSVVVAARDVAPYLGECLDSVLTGAPDQLQVVVVDDASRDDTPTIVDAYVRADARVVAVAQPTNVGLGAARNAGLDRAGGEYVWFVDGDDRLPRGALAAVWARLDRLSPDVLLLDHARLHADGRVIGDRGRTRVGRLPGLVAPGAHPRLLGIRQAAWNRVVRRDLLDQADLRFPPGWYEDVAFSHLVLLAARHVAALGQVGYLYRQRADGAITATRSPRHFEVFAQYERLFAGLGPVDVTVRQRLFEAMIEHYLVIVGTDARIPPELRPAFFAAVVRHYHRYQPAGDYEPPRGWNGFRHRFVRWDAYPAYAAARTVVRAGARLRARAHGPDGGGSRPRRPGTDAREKDLRTGR